MSHILKLTSTLASLLMLLCLASATRADPVTIEIHGDTTGGPTFNRPGAVIENQQDGVAFTPTVLSGFQVRYSLVSFTVSTGGEYTFSHLSTFNNYILLYRDGFDPDSPLTNVWLASDRDDDFKISIYAALTPGVTYFAIVTGSRPDDFGPFTLVIGGPAYVNVNQTAAVPEPATLALLATGLSGMSAALRRRRKAGAAKTSGDAAQ